MVDTGGMNMQLALSCGAVSAVTAFGAALFELQQFSRKKSRWPWRTKDDRRRGRMQYQYPTFGFWVGANVILRMAAVAVLGGVLGAVGWVADPKAGIALGLTGALSLSSLAGIKDTGVVPTPLPADGSTVPVEAPPPHSEPSDVDTTAAEPAAGGQ